MAIDPTRIARYAHGSRVPGWDDAVDLTKAPAGVPDPATTPVPDDLRADGSSKPARVHMRDPSFVNLQAFRPMVKDLYIADFIATLGMLDPVLGGIDR